MEADTCVCRADRALWHILQAILVHSGSLCGWQPSIPHCEDHVHFPEAPMVAISRFSDSIAVLHIGPSGDSQVLSCQDQIYVHQSTELFMIPLKGFHGWHQISKNKHNVLFIGTW